MDEADRKGAAGPSGLQGSVHALWRKAGRPWLAEQEALGAGIQARLAAVSAQLEAALVDLAQRATEHGRAISGVERHARGLQQHVQDLAELGERLQTLARDLQAGAQALGVRMDAVEHDVGESVEARLRAVERKAANGATRVEVLLARLEALVLARDGAGSALAAEVASARDANRGAAYLEFEDLFRGDRAEIKERQSVYVPYFEACVSAETPLVDLGCGRGEFLELARDAGITAHGVDSNPAMVKACRDLGLRVAEGDALEFLRGCDDASLGGILLAQVIEHLPYDALLELVALAAAKLKPGGAFIAETVNPKCLSTFAGAFYMDLTHIKPIHPEAARFLVQSAGFDPVDVLYLSPHDPSELLESLPEGEGEVARVVNENVARLNALLFGDRDYAVVGQR